MRHQKDKYNYKIEADGFVFDEPKKSIERERQPHFGQRLLSFFRSRYAILSALILLFGVLIFYETASLQFNPTTAAGISESVGVSRQHTVRAPRGDIVDASGLPLAWSEPVDKLYLAYTGLDGDELNERLLDIALFLEAHDVTWQSDLTQFIELAEGERPSFMLDDDEIAVWQSNRNLFNLDEPPAARRVTFDDGYIKSDPAVFYDYLLYDRFQIEDPASNTRRYRDDEAFRIMQLRYVIMEQQWAFINGTPVEIARDIPQEVVHAVYEQNYRFMGLITSRDSERVYSDLAPQIGHVLGYVGNISASQYNDLRDLGYGPDAIIGQGGVEASAERYLAGQDGIKPYNVWTVAKEEGVFFSEQIGKEPVSGNHVRLTIDMELQKVAVDSLERVIAEIRDNPESDNFHDADAGAVVMLDVRDGAVLAMASSPGYDPTDFLIQSWDDEAAARVQGYLTDNLNKPMQNRTLMEIYAPGSTFKPVTAVAGLQSGTITPHSSTIRCVGTEDIGGREWSCLTRPASGHGNLDLIEGMASSCNMYFYHLGVDSGVNQIDEWGKKLGLGELTGIDLPGEVRGFRSSRETLALLRNDPGEQVWQISHTAQTAIGQLDNTFSMLQLAVYTATLATGERVTPHVIADITRSDGSLVMQKQPQPVDAGIDAATLDAVRDSMVAVAHSRQGTAYSAFSDFPVTVAAKTGTAETGMEDFSSSNGLFILYAPADDPQVAIAQIIEKGRWGSNTIAIARDLLEAYFDFEADDSSQSRPESAWRDLDLAADAGYIADDESDDDDQDDQDD